MKGRWWLFGALALISVGCAPREVAVPVIPADYASWDLATDIELDYPIPGHLDHYRKIFVNETALDVSLEPAAVGVDWIYPPGTMFVKEIFAGQDYQPGDEPTTLTVMLKEPSHPDALEGWVYIVKDVAAGTSRVITTEYCIRCHQGANVEHNLGVENPLGEFRDYIFFPVGGQ